MEAINVYREAIKRTFAEVYQVMPETIDVSWADDGITVRCSDHTFTHKIDRDDETTLEFMRRTPPSPTRAHHLGTLKTIGVKKLARDKARCPAALS
jgi:hypothetical protein